jgi:hypothetical protein
MSVALSPFGLSPFGILPVEREQRTEIQNHAPLRLPGTTASGEIFNRLAAICRSFQEMTSA